MPAKYACPRCKTPCLIPDHLLGKPVRCGKCQQTFKAAAPTPQPILEAELVSPPAAADALSEPIFDAELIATAPNPRPRPAPPDDGRRHPARLAGQAASGRNPPAIKSGLNPWVVVLAVSLGVMVLLGGLTIVAGYAAYTLLRPAQAITAAAATDAATLDADEGRLNVEAGQGPVGAAERQPGAPPLMPPPDKDKPAAVPDKEPGPIVGAAPPAPPVDLKPAPLQADREERALPSAVDDVCVGGGGRFLILHLPRDRKLAIFDANEGKIVKYLPLAEDGARFAAGLDKLIVALPTANVLQRWSLTTFEKEVAVPSPVQGAIGDLVMGSASRGPLLVCLTNTDPFNRGGGGTFVDPLTFKPLEVKWTEGQIFGIAPGLARASADGTLFGWRNGIGGEGHDMTLVTLNGAEGRARTVGMGASLLLPSPDGRYVYTSEGVYGSQLDKIYPKTGENVSFRTFVPARQGDLFMRLEPKSADGLPPGFPGREGKAAVGAISLLLPGQYRPIAVLRDIEGVTGENLAYGGNPAQRMHHDKRIHLVPGAKLLVTIPSTNDKLVLRRFDLDALLAKSDVDYLFVASQPPRAVGRGTSLAYQLAVKSKKGGVTYHLDSGPKGMTLSPQGALRWDVPADLADADADVLITIGDASGQEVFQTFKLAVVDKAALEAQPKAPVAEATPPAPEKPVDKPVEVKTPAVAGPAENGLKPAPLQADREERALPSAADAVCVGGGGRYLILRLPRDRKLTIFDANEAKIVKYLPLAEDGAQFAAGLDKLIVALPTSNVLQRWSLTTFEKEATVPSPVTGAIARMVMGSATQGPLVIGVAGDGPGRPGAGPLFLDPKTFKADDYAVVNGEGFGGFLDFGGAGAQLRISANGDVITSWQEHVSPTGLTTMVRGGKTYKKFYQHTSVGPILPSADGQTLFTKAGLYTPETKVLRKAEDGFGRGVWMVPSVEGSYHLSFTQSGDANKPGGLVFSVAVHLAGDSRPLAALPASKDFDALVNWQTGQSQAFDQHVFLVPGAELLVLLPTSNDKLILQKFNLDQMLEKADVDYLFVSSRPVTRAVKGTAYNYPLAVKSKRGGVKVNLDAGPPGMKVEADGRLAWKVPADFADPDTDVILTVTDASGQEVLHSFKVTVTDAKDAAP